MNVANETVVSVHYRLTKDSEKGELVEETFDQQPLVYIHGIGSMIPKFETFLEGKKQGDQLSFGINADEAYGLKDEEAVIDLPIDLFKVDGIIDMEMLKVGSILPMQDGDGNAMDGIVVQVEPESVTMDFNHPLAGTNLFFEVEILDVRKASNEELEHGHVHGEGGHQH